MPKSLCGLHVPYHLRIPNRSHEGFDYEDDYLF